MIELTNPVTGHTVRTDSESVEFWRSAGYQEQPKPAEKTTKKSSTRSSSK